MGKTGHVARPWEGKGRIRECAEGYFPGILQRLDIPNRVWHIIAVKKLHRH